MMSWGGGLFPHLMLSNPVVISQGVAAALASTWYLVWARRRIAFGARRTLLVWWSFGALSVTLATPREDYEHHISSIFHESPSLTKWTFPTKYSTCGSPKWDRHVERTAREPSCQIDIRIETEESDHREAISFPVVIAPKRRGPHPAGFGPVCVGWPQTLALPRHFAWSVAILCPIAP